MLPGTEQRAGLGRGVDTRSASRRTVLLGLVVALSVPWRPRPAVAASSATVKDPRGYRDALAPRYRYALVDIRADWCAACLRIEREVFPHPDVRRVLEDIPLIKADVTAMDDGNRELLAHLRADGPPTLFVVDTASGAERARTRSVGSVKRRELMRRLTPFTQG